MKGRDWNLRELSKNVISRITICTKLELREWQFFLFFVISNENLKIILWFHVKLLELQESGKNSISQLRTEVKRDSMKC